MPARGRQPYVATVNGTVDGVPFTNWFKYLTTAKRNAREGKFTLTIIETGHMYRWSNKTQKFHGLMGAPELEPVRFRELRLPPGRARKCNDRG